MTMDYRKLIELHIECEGLLRVLAERPADADALGLLRRRHAEIAALLASDAPPAESTPAADEPERIAVVAAVPEMDEAEMMSSSTDEDIVIVLDSEDDSEATTVGFSAVENALEEDDTEAAAPEAAAAPARSAAAPAATARPELRRCFTLNDKFRFIREIFGGSEREFADTLTLLADMASYAEAEDYICGDLALDREEPAVAEFLSIIEANMPASAPEK